MNITCLALKEVNCYVIELKEGYLLVDTGYYRNKSLFYKKLRENNIKLEQIRYILLTHHHDDHAGLISEIKNKYPQCKLILHEEAIRPLQIGKNDMKNQKYVNGKISFIVRLAKSLNRKWTFFYPAYELQHNDVVIKKERSLKEIGIEMEGKILLTPGHSRDSISLLLGDGSCFCGDAAADMLRPLGTRYCVIVMEEYEKYYKNWETYIEQQVSLLYPGHGKVFGIEKLEKHLYRVKKENMKNAE